ITYNTTGATGASFSSLPTGVTGAWASNVVTISGTPSVSGTFNFTVTLTGGCGTVTANGSLTITPFVGQPAFALGTSSVRCQGSETITYTATASNATGIVYSLDAASITGGNSIVTNTGVVTYTAGWSGTSIITATASGCNGPTTAVHTVTTNPNLPVSISVSPSYNPVCAGTSVTYTAIPTNGGTTPTYQWSVNGSNVGSNSATYADVPVNGNTILCTLTSNATCATGSPASSNTITMAVTTLPVATFSYTASPYCQDTSNPSPTFSGGGIAGIFSSTAGLTFISNLTGQINLASSLPGIYTVTNTVAASGGCSQVMSTSSISINTITSILSQATSGQTQCQGGTFTPISVTANGVGLNYQWFSNTLASNAGGTSLGSANGAQTGIYTPQATASGTMYYYCAITGTCGTVTSAVSGAFVVNQIPVITTTNPGSQCGPGPITISATASIGTINWYAASSGGALLATGPAYTTPTLSATTTYYAEANNNGCTSPTRTPVVATIIPIASLTVGGGGTFCTGSNITLTSSGTNVSNQYWQGPNNFYSTDANPVISSATAIMSGTYTITASSVSGVNLIYNGDFEAGNISFGSGYTVGTDLVPEGRYAVVANPNTVHASFINCSDHTPSGTLQMVVNGATVAGVNVWSQTVNVAPNSDYQFTYWIQSVVGNNASQLQLYVNGVAAGPVYTAITATCQWAQFLYNWNSGSSTTAYLSLVNQNIVAGGNDFALDDIIFQQVCTVASGSGGGGGSGSGGTVAPSASIDVVVNAAVTAGTIGNPQTICSGSTPSAITSTGSGSGSGTISYEWQSNGSGSYVTIAGASSATYSPPALTTTTSYQRRTVSLSGGITCYSAYTSPVMVTVRPTPTASISGTTAVCRLGAAPNITFTNPQVYPITITYNINGLNQTTINVAASGSATVAAPTGTAGTFNYNLVSVVYQTAPICSNSITGTATVNVSTATPTTPGAISGIAAQCSGLALQTYSVSAVANALSYIWTVPTGWSITSGSGTNSITVTTGAAGQSGNITVAASNGCGTSTAASLPVTVRQNPVATISGTTTLCQNASNPNITFANPQTSAITITYNINGSNQSTINVGASTSATLAAPTSVSGTFAYNLVSVIYQSAPSCSNPVTGAATVTVTPTVGTPVFSIGTTSSRCQGAGQVTYTATASNSTGITYTLDAASITGGNSIVGSTGVVSYVAGWTGTSTITASATGCNGPKVATHTVTTTPIVGTPSTPTPSNTTICQGSGTTDFTTSSTNATSYNWSVTGTGNTISGTGTTATVTWASGFSGTATISVTANGCSGPSSLVSTGITVRPTPTASISGTTTVCQNTSSPNVVFTNQQSLPITITYNINGANQTTINVGANGTSNIAAPTSTAGVFTYNLVSAVYQTLPSCTNAITGSAGITVTAIPSATISYLNSPYCKNLLTAQSVTRTGTSGGTYSSLPTGLTLDVNTGAIIPNTSSAGTYSVTYTVAASGGCSIYSTNASVTIVSDQVWTGTVSTDWNIAGNWSCNVIPDLTTNVLIPNVTNQPILSNGAIGKSKNIVINSGSSLTVSGNKLQIAGTISNSGIFTSSAGTIEMKGSVNQLIPSNCFAGNTIMNLNIDNSAGTTLQGPLSISGIVDAINGNLSAGGYLTLISTATQTALIDGSGTGEVLGNVNIQRYLPSAFGYKYFSTPFQSATVNVFEPEVNLSATFPSFYKYDENNSIDSSGVTVYTSGWVKYNNPAYALVPLVGYAANFGSLLPSKTLEISGIVNNGSFQVSLLNHNRKYTKGFNLVGNPYPSPTDWDKLGWTKSNIDNAIYFFNAGNTNQYTGVYSSYVNGVSTGNANNIIPALQGFFVHVTDGTYPVSATLGTTNTVRINDLNPLFKAAVIDNRPILRFAASFETKNAIDDIAVIYFDGNAKKSFEKDVDALKMNNTDLLIPNLYTIDPGANKLSINGMQIPVDSISKIPLGIGTLSDGWIVFKAKDIIQLPLGMNLYLLDSQIDVTQDLKLNPEYRVYLKTGEYNQRFALVFSKSDLSKVPDTRRKMFTLSRSSDHINVKVNLPLDVGGNLLVTNMKGQVLLQKKVFEMESVELNSNLSSGVFVITLISDNKTESEKILMRKDYE
ncbi:MAG: T9SS type A sorting domain-containing protein, partial [Mariniphaga sp.]